MCVCMPTAPFRTRHACWFFCLLLFANHTGFLGLIYLGFCSTRDPGAFCLNPGFLRTIALECITIIIGSFLGSRSLSLSVCNGFPYVPRKEVARIIYSTRNLINAQRSNFIPKYLPWYSVDSAQLYYIIMIKENCLN